MLQSPVVSLSQYGQDKIAVSNQTHRCNACRSCSFLVRQRGTSLELLQEFDLDCCHAIACDEESQNVKKSPHILVLALGRHEC
jgi:hypothetical protein